MAGDLEQALRALLKSVITEALDEVLSERSFETSRSAKAHSNSDDRFLLRAREAAKRLAVSERHLHKLTMEGILPCVRVGRLVHYSVETIEQWIRDTESNDAPKSKRTDKEKTERTTASPAGAKKTQSADHRPARKQNRRLPETQTRPTRKARQTITSRSEPVVERTFPFDLLLNEIGVDRSVLPPLTNGELMRIAEVDIPTFHGWQYLNRELPEEALRKLREHFVRYRDEHAGDVS